MITTSCSLDYYAFTLCKRRLQYSIKMMEAVVAVQPKALLVPNEEVKKAAEKSEKQNEQSASSSSPGDSCWDSCYSGGHDCICWPLCINHNKDGDDSCGDCGDADCNCDLDCGDCDCGDCTIL